MSCEPTLRAWLGDLLSAMTVLLEDPETDVQPEAEPEPLAGEEARIDGFTEDTRSTMDTLRLCIKYLVFDLQATRRENQNLRRKLAQHREQDGEA